MYFVYLDIMHVIWIVCWKYRREVSVDIFITELILF
jgi:hypothetical protein